MGQGRAGRKNQLFEKGVLALVTGGGLLVAPLITGGVPVLQSVAQGLKAPAWLVIGLGVFLLTADRLVRKFTQPSSSKSEKNDSPPARPRSADMFPPEMPPAPGKPRQDRDLTSDAPPSPTPLAVQCPKREKWVKEVFDDIEWRRFEAVCERLFAQAGFVTKSQSHGADGGVDIWLYSRHSEGPAAVVQCKHWVGSPVGVKELREFFGVMTSQSLRRGTFATSSTFTATAIEFAKQNGINILDAKGLLGLIGRRSEQQQRELLVVAYDGEYWRPTCASCGVKLVERVAAKDSSRFWGCVNFPRCRTRMGVPGA